MARQDFQTGITALSKIAKVYLGVQPGSKLVQTKDAVVTVFDGKCPAGNVGVQINHINPVNKGDVVWTIGAEEVIFIGRLFNEGKVNLTRTIAVAGSEIKTPQYKQVLVGGKIGDIEADNVNTDKKVRLIDGNPLTGMKTSEDAFLYAHTTEVTAIPEGDDADELFGWISPRVNEFSVSRSYFTWLQSSKKEYVLDARVKGGHRHMIFSGDMTQYSQWTSILSSSSRQSLPATSTAWRLSVSTRLLQRTSPWQSSWIVLRLNFSA